MVKYLMDMKNIRDLRTGLTEVCGPGYPTSSGQAQHQLLDLMSNWATKSALRKADTSS